MNLSINRIRREFFSIAEKQVRRDRENCLYCETFDHFVINYLNKSIIKSIFVIFNIFVNSQINFDTFQLARVIIERL